MTKLTFDGGCLVRQACPEDVKRMMEIISGAVTYMHDNGIAQWSSEYPSPEILLSDIARGEGCVCLMDGEIVGTAALSLGGEPDYNEISEGQWLTRGKYGVIHRLAMDDRIKGRGLAGVFVDAIEKMCINHGIFAVRVDTHRDNRPMRRFLEKNGFIYCGIIYTSYGGARVAYEKELILGETE